VLCRPSDTVHRAGQANLAASRRKMRKMRKKRWGKKKRDENMRRRRTKKNWPVWSLKECKVRSLVVSWLQAAKTLAASPLLGPG